ncbi:MAG: sialidase family protein [Desulfovibrionales bacterium]
MQDGCRNVSPPEKPKGNSGLHPGLVLLLTAALFAAPLSARTGKPGVTWGEWIEVAEGEAYRGPWRMNESDWRFVDDATVAITEQGSVGVVWADQEKQDLFIQVVEPDGQARFSEPVNISRSPDTFSWLPRVVMTSKEPEEIAVLWQEIIFSGGTHGGEIFFARSTDGGRSFSRPLNLSRTVAGAGKGRLTREIWFNGSLDLVRSRNSTLYAAWTVYEGTLHFSRSTDGGKSFSDPLLLEGGESNLPARGPSLAVYHDDVWLAWAVGEKQDADIFYTVSRDGGQTFSKPRKAVESTGHSEAPKLAVDEGGIVHLLYGESPAGLMQSYHIRHASTEDDGGFGASREISGGHSDRFESVNFPYLALDESKNLYVAWELFPDSKIRSRGLGFTFSDDRGKTFAPPSVVPGTLDNELGFNGSQQGLYMDKLAVNGKGDLAVVNCTFKPNESSHIRLIRGSVEKKE